MNILINGASGYIGYYLVDECLREGHNVYAVCRDSVGLLKHIKRVDNLNIIRCGQDQLADYISDLHIDVWYQLLWEGACGELRRSAEVQLKNEMMAVQAMQTAHNIGCPKIIHTGTVYENMADNILDDISFNNNSFYIIVKKHTRDITSQLAKKLGIRSIWCQFCHPIGAYMNENQMFTYAVKSFINNRLTEFGSCSNYFDIISVQDLVHALRVLGEHDSKKDFYYIGSNNPQKLKCYIEKAAEMCGYEMEIGFGKRPDDGLEFDKKWFDASDFVSEFGKIEGIGFDGGLINLIFYLREEKCGQA